MYSVLDLGCKNDQNVQDVGITLNVSPSGACLYVFREVSPGDRLTFKNSVFEESCADAVVRWANKVSSKIYKIGLMCMNDM
ncbi:MAG: hypothetical protein D6726_02555 [Nitrospirae bacterium]|nr:MAG: hypothetical protein D6726_02555 [Nitrospirota bacterium]